MIGASSGVGGATVKALLSDGARITAVARGAQGLERLQREFEGGIESAATMAAATLSASGRDREKPGHDRGNRDGVEPL